MNHDNAVINAVSTAARVGYGILLPVATFLAYQVALIGSTSGTGSWDGMGIAFGSLVIVPALLALNCWVIPIRWIRRRTVSIAGMILPAVIGAVEYLWLHGPYTIRAAINSTMVASYFWIWVFIVLLCAPLAVSITRAVIQRRART